MALGPKDKLSNSAPYWKNEALYLRTIKHKIINNVNRPDSGTMDFSPYYKVHNAMK